jgi:hypothetical protein
MQSAAIESEERKISNYALPHIEFVEVSVLSHGNLARKVKEITKNIISIFIRCGYRMKYYTVNLNLLLN